MEGSLKVRSEYALVTFNALKPPPYTGITNSPITIQFNECRLYGYTLHNNDGAAAAWLQIFFKPANEVTLGTTSPDKTLRIATGGSITDYEMQPWRGARGFTVAATTTETGSTAPGSPMTGEFAFNT